MKKHLVKNGRKILGFVHIQNGVFYYSFGKPSQCSYISFECRDLEQGIARIEMHTNGGNF
jgi:hypothetical protein